MDSHRVRLLKAGASQAAAVIVANRSREVLALVGSCAYGPRDRGFNNGAAAWRSPGSALKPFLYAQALDQGFTPASMLEDVERRYRTPGGEFIPANFDRVPYGPISFREALANSLNLSTVSLLNLISPETYYDTLSRLNLINHPERGPEHYGLGLVVGNPEVSLLQLAAAYACLANGGLYQPLRLRADAPATAAGAPLLPPGRLYHQRHPGRSHGPLPHLRGLQRHESSLPPGHQDRHQFPLPGHLGGGLHPGIHRGGLGGQF